ncbi:probable hexosyltransferase MUCI70 [Primulina eburnea]|uniref:probable hexosyltransferase MUCI70 n=1 Tax=Primulina eburnea TaxID=1245227 RepID=UPI003C6CAC43
MTGGSLGLRASGSYGLLQQHPLNGGLPPQNLYIPRRPSKSSFNGYKEKERHVHSIFRYLSQRKVGMLVLASLALVAFTTGFFTVNKEAYLGNTSLDFDTRDPNMSHVLSSWWTGKEAMLYDSSVKMNKVTVCVENAGWYPSISHASAADVDPSTASFSDNPCKNFAFPPPPPGDRRRVGPRPCPVCYVPVEHAIASIPKFPSESSVLSHLTYFSEENPLRTEPNGGSEFGGYPSLKQRKDSFDIKESMTVHCGFVKGCGPRDQTGFDIDADDLKELEQFHEVIVASAIFGNYDVIQQPRNVGEVARKNVPFFMFIDKETEAYMKNTSVLDGGKQVGLWRIIVVQNVPYNDARRNGKVPKLLLHRLFPNVRYSIWIDGKLRLVVDPYQILEKFLWRQNATFAISRHYSRFDVFEEAEANKAAGKYDNTSIDHQIDYYKKEGLTPYTLDKLPITSDVPEGCVIIREHIPMTNLFSCLWFNEVDRFTSRDQLSFATVRDKVKERVNWNINMFLDCERRNFVIQAYHRDLLEQRAHQQAMTRIHPPPVLIHEKNPVKRNLVRPGRGSKKPTSRRRRKIIPRNKENFFI